jgi:phosphoribosylformylglycinamidine synthase
MRSAVVVFPGSNRDHDMMVALEKIAGRAPVAVWHGDSDMPKVDLIVLPGGFSYGDYLRSGAIAARSPVMRVVAERAQAGVPVLGVCNGFQILCESGLLPGVLMRNAGLRFICRDVKLRVETSQSAFTSHYQKGEVVTYPVAHGDGNYRCDEETHRRLAGEDRVAFRYVGDDGQLNEGGNRNGSLDSIAGVLSEKRNVLGLMPHPENMIEALHGGSDGRRLFEGLVSSLDQAA